MTSSKFCFFSFFDVYSFFDVCLEEMSEDAGKWAFLGIHDIE
jgi:hypothetical protein